MLSLLGFVVFILLFSRSETIGVTDDDSEYLLFSTSAAGRGGLRTPSVKVDNVAATSADIGGPMHAWPDTNGDLFVCAFYGNHRIFKVSHATGNISTYAGIYTSSLYNGDNIPATSAALDPIMSWSNSLGNLYVADQNNSRIRVIDGETTKITTVIGNGKKGYDGDGKNGTMTTINRPASVVGDTLGNIYFADTYNYLVRKLDVATNTIITIAGTRKLGYNGDNIAATLANINFPQAIWLETTGNLLIAQGNYNQNAATIQGYLSNDQEFSIVRRYSKTTKNVTTVAGNVDAKKCSNNGSALHTKLSYLSGIYSDTTGNIFIPDSGLPPLVRKVLANTDTIVTIAGGGETLADNVPATSALFLDCDGISGDSVGNLYIGDTKGGKVRKLFEVNYPTYSPTYSGYTNSATDDTDLSKDEVAGIAVGSFAAGMIIAVVVVAIVYSSCMMTSNTSQNQNNNKSNPKDIENEQIELRPTTTEAPSATKSEGEVKSPMNSTDEV